MKPCNNKVVSINQHLHYKKEKGFENPIALSLEQMKIISDQMKNSLIKIILPRGFATGFICKILLRNNYILNAVVTNNHVIGEEDILPGKIISFSMDNDKIKFELKIDKNRLLYTSFKYDIIIIEIKENDKLNFKSFLEIDDCIFKEDYKEYCQKKKIYFIHYPLGKEAQVSSGIIKDIQDDNYTLMHLCNSEAGSAGGPLLNLVNFKVIGIHKGASRKNYNVGTCLNKPIEELSNIYSKDFNNNISNNNNNELYNEVIKSLKNEIKKLDEKLAYSDKIIINQKNQIEELKSQLNNKNNAKDNLKMKY